MSRIGLMGCGTVAGYGHLPAIAATEGLDLHAVFDPDTTRVEEVRERYHVPGAYTDVDAFFQSGIDAVAVTSPAPCHRDNVTAAARHGIHVLCEKPLAMNEAECREMIAAASQAGIMLFTGFDYRFSPAALRIRDLVRAGAVGRVGVLRLIYIWNNHGKYQRDGTGAQVENARRRGRMEEGGPMVDCGVHQIDLARFWLGSDVVDWQVAGAWVDEYEAPDHMWLHMTHENGAHSMVEMSYSYCHTAAEPLNRFTYEIIGSEGVILYDRAARRFELRTAAGTTVFDYSPEKNFAGMYAAFADALRTGRSEVLPTGRDGLVAASISRQATERLIAAGRPPR